MTTVQQDLRLPRSEWDAHPHYPRQTLLLGAHEGFRRLSRGLVDRAASGGDIRNIGWVFEYWKAGMSGHEAYEEGKLYPYLEARWDVSCEPLREGHEALADVDHQVRAAITARDRDALCEALEAHDRVLDAHLEAEEALVIPALLALEPSEFDVYYDSDIESLLAGLDRGA